MRLHEVASSWFINIIKDNWVGQILRNCLLKHVTDGQKEGRREVTGRRGRRRKHLIDALRDKWGYWKLNEETLDHIVWRTRFGRGYGPVVGQTLQHEK
jgi:hypothetical protein